MRECIVVRFDNNVGTPLRSIIFNAEECFVAITSHVSVNILLLLHSIFGDNIRYVIVASKILGSTDAIKSVKEHIIIVDHHYKYYLVDGLIAVEGSANLTESEFNDMTPNFIRIEVASRLEDTKRCEIHRSIIDVFRTLTAGYKPRIQRLLKGTSCSYVLGMQTYSPA